MKTEMRKVESVEDKLVKKENALEEKVENGNHDSWGEELGHEHHIDMKPLMPHFFPSHPFHSLFRPFEGFRNHHTVRDMGDGINHAKDRVMEKTNKLLEKIKDFRTHLFGGPRIHIVEEPEALKLD